MTEKLTEKSKKVIDNTLKMVYIIPCIAAVVRQPDAGKYARVAQWWSTSCQGGGRGFDPRLALYRKDKTGVKAEKLWHRLLSLCLTAHVTNG